MSTGIPGLKFSDIDNVATVFAVDVADGDQVEVKDQRGCVESLTVHGNVPYGHKIALRDIHSGELITKYGEIIGMASKNIQKGEHVHIHNLDALRGRGDL